ncbi:MAG: hypothetical protein WC869_10775 [Phycisphaerae bacterium]
MTQTPFQGPVIQVKPQPDVYTLLILVAILALAITLGTVLYFLLSAPPTGAGLKIGDLVGHVKALGAK